MMRPMPHLRYAKYVAVHKWFVLIAGLKTGAPIWRLLIHDWSKLTCSEWGPYVRRFYDKDRERPGEFDEAWRHHQAHNPHHWQYWTVTSPVGVVLALEDPMPDHFVREMVADWMGAGRAITGQWEVHEWYDFIAGKMVLHRDTRSRVEKILTDLP